jgi:transcription initiation factor IIE alpha subunit
MALTQAQFHATVEAYTNFIVDNMDSDTMVQMVHETLENHFSEYTDEQLINEISEQHGDEILESLGVNISSIESF